MSEEESKPENGDIYNQDGDHIGHLEAFKEIGDIVDAELGIYHEGKLYVFKLDYRTNAEFTE